MHIPKQWNQGIKTECAAPDEQPRQPEMDEKTAASIFYDDHQEKHSLC
jgi:hypothetical protein